MARNIARLVLLIALVVGVGASWTSVARINAHDITMQVGAGGVLEHVPAGGVPAAPSGLVVSYLSTSSLRLTWVNPATDETGTRVYRSLTGTGSWSLITTTAANATTYDNTGLTSATRYYYYVDNINGSGDSTDSNISTGLTTDLSDTVLNANGTWSDDFDYGAECAMNAATPAVDCNSLAPNGIVWSDYDSGNPLNTAGYYQSVVTAAANPNTLSPYGARFWNDDGTNAVTPKAKINLEAAEPELWVRWYMRYQPGFAWSSGNPNYDKTIYFWENGPGGVSILFEHASGTFMILSGSGAFTEVPASPTISWQDVFGATSDGLFHLFEMHVKMDTDGTDGIAQAWIDGVKIIDSSTADFNGMLGIKRGDFHSNQSSVSNSGPEYIDYSDMEWSINPSQISPDGDRWIGPANNYLGG
ncbi:fibronectin type III domain-containing protein [uncultured Paraglaciecola sp.]|uniref:fibronectin type III domain-containing protein n=1 Tax=uncultured Paraglaciecola sp. TaxID=1765024 RepID=UPI002623EAD8|nr:fibronectin type III domain-containing protein [uncultured Paraglaciecola sp.]